MGNSLAWIGENKQEVTADAVKESSAPAAAAAAAAAPCSTPHTQLSSKPTPTIATTRISSNRRGEKRGSPIVAEETRRSARPRKTSQCKDYEYYKAEKRSISATCLGAEATNSKEKAPHDSQLSSKQTTSAGDAAADMPVNLFLPAVLEPCSSNDPSVVGETEEMPTTVALTVDNVLDWDNSVLIRRDCTLKSSMASSFFKGFLAGQMGSIPTDNAEEIQSTACSVYKTVGDMRYSFAEEQSDERWALVSEERAIALIMQFLQTGRAETTPDRASPTLPPSHVAPIDDPIEPLPCQTEAPTEPITLGSNDVMIGKDGTLEPGRASEVVAQIMSAKASQYVKTAKRWRDAIVSNVITTLHTRRIRFFEFNDGQLVESSRVVEALHMEFKRLAARKAPPNNGVAHRPRKSKQSASTLQNHMVRSSLAQHRRTVRMPTKHSISGLLFAVGRQRETAMDDNTSVLLATALRRREKVVDETSLEERAGEQNNLDRNIAMGPGKFANDGNVHYAAIIDAFGPTYHDPRLTDEAKEQMAETIVDELLNENRSFVVKKKDDWVPVDREKALKKVNLALRTWMDRKDTQSALKSRVITWDNDPVASFSVASEDVSSAASTVEARSPDSFATNEVDASPATQQSTPIFHHALLLGDGTMPGSTGSTPTKRVSMFPISSTKQALWHDDDTESHAMIPEDPLFHTDDILSPLEMQLLYLGEEGMYCLQKLEFDFAFIYFYATEELKVHLRQLDSDACEATKIVALLSPDWQVRNRFESGRKSVRHWLLQGNRREIMAATMAEIRISLRMGRELCQFPPLDLLSLETEQIMEDGSS